MSTSLDRRAVLRGLGALGLGAVFVRVGAACSGGEEPSESGDLGSLNLLLSVEHVAADLYRRGLDADLVSGRDLALIESVAQHESDHVEVLRMTIEDLGGTAVGSPEVVYPDGLFGDAERFLSRVQRLEDLAVGAYQGQLPRIREADVLETVASIAGTESRHAALVARLVGAGPLPSDVERGEGEGAVRDALEAFVDR